MPQNRKEAVLKAAKNLFGEYGYAETTFKKISERANVAMGLLTHHYGNKEKLFLACGLDVLENFLAFLKKNVQNSENGFKGVMQFCSAYLDFSINPESNWLVLVRCSPYSDMKTSSDRALMDSSFTRIHELLQNQLIRGVADGSIYPCNTEDTAQVITSLLVGVNRTRVLTPYAPENLYADALNFVARAIKAD